MNYTEQQMLDKAKVIIKDLQGELYKEENIRKVRYDAKRVMSRGKHKDKEHPSWVVVIDDPVFDTTDFLTISDETGEPLYIQSKHAVYEIAKDSEGKYV